MQIKKQIGNTLHLIRLINCEHTMNKSEIIFNRNYNTNNYNEFNSLFTRSMTKDKFKYEEKYYTIKKHIEHNLENIVYSQTETRYTHFKTDKLIIYLKTMENKNIDILMSLKRNFYKILIITAMNMTIH